MPFIFVPKSHLFSCISFHQHQQDLINLARRKGKRSSTSRTNTESDERYEYCLILSFFFCLPSWFPNPELFGHDEPSPAVARTRQGSHALQRRSGVHVSDRSGTTDRIQQRMTDYYVYF